MCFADLPITRVPTTTAKRISQNLFNLKMSKCYNYENSNEISYCQTEIWLCFCYYCCFVYYCYSLIGNTNCLGAFSLIDVGTASQVGWLAAYYGFDEEHSKLLTKSLKYLCTSICGIYVNT